MREVNFSAARTYRAESVARVGRPVFRAAAPSAMPDDGALPSFSTTELHCAAAVSHVRTRAEDGRVDNAIARAYLETMSRFARIMIVTLLAAFVAGTVAHASDVAAMATSMAAMQADAPADGQAEDGQAADEAGFAGCDACALDEEGVVGCDFACTPHLLADVERETSLRRAFRTADPAPGDVSAVGVGAPPEPAPPRADILI